MVLHSLSKQVLFAFLLHILRALMAELQVLVCPFEFPLSLSILLLCVELLRKRILLLLDQGLAIT